VTGLRVMRLWRICFSLSSMANIKLFQKYFFPRARRALYEIRQIPHIPQKSFQVEERTGARLPPVTVYDSRNSSCDSLAFSRFLAIRFYFARCARGGTERPL
jgi:hypothetical protein